MVKELKDHLYHRIKCIETQRGPCMCVVVTTASARVQLSTLALPLCLVCLTAVMMYVFGCLMIKAVRAGFIQGHRCPMQ